jgi:hypothetical protein
VIVVALNKLHHAVGHDPAQSDQAAEIARLRRELDWTRMERDVLKNVWPAPSVRSPMKMPVTGLHKRIRHVGTEPPPRWRAARPVPHKRIGLGGRFFCQASGTPLDRQAIFTVLPQTS